MEPTKLYRVELKGVGEITADLRTFKNLEVILYDASRYCLDRSSQAQEQGYAMLPSLYKEDYWAFDAASEEIKKMIKEIEP